MNKETKDYVEGLIQKHTQCDVGDVNDWVGVLREDPSRAFDIVDELCEALDIGDPEGGLKSNQSGVDLSDDAPDNKVTVECWSDEFFKGGY